MDTIMDVVPKLSKVVPHYASHCLCANVQFSKIATIMQSMKKEPFIIYVIPDHNQKLLQMMFLERKGDWFGKKGMSFLSTMEVRWKVDGKCSGFEYLFVYYVVKGYSGQDYVQVASVVQLKVQTV